MTSKNNNNERVSEEFIRNLEATTELVQQLIRDIREGEIDFATIKTELRILVENVKALSSLIRESEDGIAGLKTQVALLEKTVSELEEWVKSKKHKEHEESTALKVADKNGKWQTLTAITAGALAFVTAVVTLIVNLLSK